MMNFKNIINAENQLYDNKDEFFDLLEFKENDSNLVK
jgi:hypothetical protein